MAIWHAQGAKMLAKGATVDEIAVRFNLRPQTVERWAMSLAPAVRRDPVRVADDPRTPLQRLADEGPSAAYRAARAQAEARSSTPLVGFR